MDFLAPALRLASTFALVKESGASKRAKTPAPGDFHRSMQAAYTFGNPKNGAAKLPTDPGVSKAISGDLELIAPERTRESL
jgi:hypothetical protein